MGVPQFVAVCRSLGLPEPVAEYRFASKRKWAFDWAWPSLKVALEIEGGIWTQGRHTRGKGFLGDIAKYNEAAIRGWRVLRCSVEQFEDGSVLALVDRALTATVRESR